MAPPWCTLLRASRPSVGRRVQLPSSAQECLELAWRSLFDAVGDGPTLRMWLAPGLELDERYYEALRDGDAPPDALHFTWNDEEYLQGSHGATYVAKEVAEVRPSPRQDEHADVVAPSEDVQEGDGEPEAQQDLSEWRKAQVQAQIYEGRDLQSRLVDMEETLSTTCDRLRRVQDERRRKLRAMETKKNVVVKSQQHVEEQAEEEQAWGEEEMAHARRVRQLVRQGLKVPQ